MVIGYIGKLRNKIQSVGDVSLHAHCTEKSWITEGDMIEKAVVILPDMQGNDPNYSSRNCKKLKKYVNIYLSLSTIFILFYNYCLSAKIGRG